MIPWGMTSSAPVDLSALAEQKLEEAMQASSGRASVTVHGGRDHRLRQTLLAMRAGEELAEHSSPGEATLQVLRGRIVLRVGEERHDIRAGELLTIPDAVHAVEVPEHSAFLLTVALREG